MSVMEMMLGDGDGGGGVGVEDVARGPEEGEEEDDVEIAVETAADGAVERGSPTETGANEEGGGGGGLATPENLRSRISLNSPSVTFLPEALAARAMES